MRNYKKIIFGIVLLIVGVVVALNLLGIADIDLLFPGWWTLFIIIPCGVGLFTERDKIGSLVGIVIGVLLLLSQNDIIDFSYVWKGIVILVIFSIALKMIISGFGHKNKRHAHVNINISDGGSSATAIFGGREVKYDDSSFVGGDYTAIFGGVDCDLSGAIIEKDCTINATAIFGGVDIILPKNVNVEVSSSSVFGGVEEDVVKNPDATITVYINASVVFGGVEVKNHAN